MLPSFARDTVTIVRPAWVDERGKRIPDYTVPAEKVTVVGCSVQPVSSTETLPVRQGVTVRAVLYAPPGTVIGAHDSVEWGGRMFAVDGDGLAWSSPTGAVSHVLAYLVDWEG